MIDWNGDGRVDPAEMALTLLLISGQEDDGLSEPWPEEGEDWDE